MAFQHSLLIVVLLVLSQSCRAADFKKCYQGLLTLLPLNASGQPDFNGTITSARFSDPVYHGPIRGFRYNDAPDQRPLTLTVQGCIDACGPGPELNGIVDAFSIMTTWVLPAIALLSQLPYESLSNDKIKNVEAFGNWLGGPGAALTTTIWNVLMIQKCRILSESPKEPRMQSVLRDSLYILSCVNQYEYPRTERVAADRRRDIALLRGVLYPYIDNNDQDLPETLRKKLENMTTHLAFQLRLQRRKGVYPLWLNLVWFLIAFAFSIVTAFAQLGDNTTAHSLALGLLLSWMPTLVLAAIVDRNPVSATRCGILVERWLYKVDALFAEHRLSRKLRMAAGETGEAIIQRPHSLSVSSEAASNSQSDDGEFLTDSDYQGPGKRYRRSFRSRRQDTEQQIALQRLVPRQINMTQWHKEANVSDFRIGEFVGQGRKMRYCAVTNTVLDILTHPNDKGLHLPDTKEAAEFRKALPKRPPYWYLVWLVSQILVGAGYATAFVVSFQTPTIGLGCRTLAYTIWYLLSFFSWAFLGIWQEPPMVVRIFSWIPNALASLALFGIMLLQSAGALNDCLCKSSTFGGSQFGGYMDFENAQFYQSAYEVQEVWALATAFGSLSAVSGILWFWRRWSRDSSLWRINEAAEIDVVDGVDLNWLI